jgi:hypothetical protein
MFIIEALFNLFFGKYEPEMTYYKPDPVTGQLWLSPDDVVDRYCTPVVLTVVEVEEGVVYYKCNYRDDYIFEDTVENFKSKYVSQSSN